MSEADVAAAAAHTDPPQAPAAEPVAAPEVTPGAVATPRIAPADGAAPPATPTDDAAKDKKEKKSKKERSDKTGKEKKEKKHRDKKEKSHRSHRSHRSKAAGGDPTSNESPAYYSTKLKLEPNPTVLRQLATVAAAKDATWVGNFIDIHGLKLLGDLLQTYQARPNKTAAELEDISASVAALKSVLSHENALLEVSRSRHTVRRLLLCMAPAGIDLEVQGTVIELLFTIFVKTPTGYQVTLDAFTNYAKEQRQPRFRILLDYLKKATEPSHQLIGFSLLDRLCSTPEDIDLRSSIYAEYQRAGLTEVIEHLKAVPSDDLQEAISEFEKDVREDTEELEKRFESLGIDFKDGAVLANTLNSQLGPTPVYTCWLSILRDLLAFPGETDTGIKAWMLIQRLVMQLSLQKSTLAINETSIKVEDLFASVADAPDVAKLSKQLADVQQDKQKLEKALASKEIEYKDKDITLTQLKSQLAESQEAAKAWEERARADAAELRTAHETMAQLEEKLKNAAGAAPAPAAAPAVDPAALAELQAKHTAELAAQADKTKAAEAKVTELEAKLAAAPAAAAPAAAAPAAAAPTERAAPAEGAAAAPATPVAAAAADPAVAEKLAKSESDLKAAEEKIKELQAKLDAAAAAGGAAPAADAAPVVTGGPPPPPAPKAPKAPPAPKLMMKGKLPPPGPAAPPAEGGDAAAAPAAPAEGGEGGAAPSGGPPPPPPPGGPKGPPPPPGPKGPPPPPGPKGPPPPPGPGGPPPPPGPGGPPPPPGLKGPPKGPPGKGPGLGLKGPAAAAEPAGPPKKRPQPPTKKMKGLAWNKVPAPKLGNSIWAKTGELEVPLDYTLVEDMFSFETKEAGPKEGDKGANKKKEPVTLIDGKRAQNINIFLGSKLSKVSFADLKKAILALDETVLTQEIVKLLVTYMPTDEELTQIEDWKKDNDSKPEDEKYPLGKAETFMLEMKSVPNCAERLQSLLFKLNFPVKLTETKPDIVSLKAASSVLKTSKNLTKMLEVMLWVGNFLNASNNAKANFDGFKVDFLTKLSDTKSNPKYAKELPTVLHFLVHLVDEKYPDLKDLPTELEVTKAAAKCSLPTSEAEVAALRKGLTALEGALNKVKPLPLGGVPATPRAGAPPAASPRGPPSTGDATAEHTEPVAPPSAPTGETDPSDKFQAVMRDFAAQARKDFDELEGLLKEAVAAYQETLVYFAEDPKLAPEEFFKVWSTFVTQWERARDEIRKAAEAKKKLEERAAKATHDPKKPAATGKAAAKAAAAAALASGTTRGRKKIDISAEAIEAATNAPAAKDDESSSSSSSSESEGEGPEKTPRAPKEKKEHKEGEHSPSAPAPAAGGDEGKPAAPAAEAPKPAASKFKAKPKGANADDIMAALGAVLKKPGAKK